jgi:GTP cyclohydrolase II
MAEKEFEQIKKEAKSIKLIISKYRTKFLGVETIDHAIIEADSLTFDKLIAISGVDLTIKYNLLNENMQVTRGLDPLIHMLIQAELIPSALLIEPQDKRILYNFNQMEAGFSKNLEQEFNLYSRAQLNLKITNKPVELIAFNAIGSNIEHYAIIVGEIGNTPLVRLHSACFTGDLLTSLSCDCYEQFHLAIAKMAEHKEGGVILYLQQDGRGIGLANKLKTYNLQFSGINTKDANLALGFPDDARELWPATKMLNLLKINQIELLTNNPKKIQFFTDSNIQVINDQRHYSQINQYNKNYIETKINEMGHHKEE